MKFVMLDGFLTNFDGIGLDLGEHEQIWYDQTQPQQVVERIGDADGIVVNRVVISREIMQHCPNLKYIGTFGTGYNNVEVEAAKELGIVVCNAPGYSTMAVAQHTIALLLEVVGRVGQFDAFVRSGIWGKEGYANIASMPTYELCGKTLGILGAGEIGRQVAHLGQAFGMHTLAYRRTPPKESTITYVDLDTLLSQSDVLSLHCPLTPETYHIINTNALQKMKHGAILLNTARGDLLDEQAVAQALDCGTLLGLGVDVLSKEPPEEGHPFYRHPHAVVTPHIAWIPHETRERLLHIVEENILQFIKGTPQNVVTK